VVVVWGDSQIDGTGSTPDAAKRFVNQLDDRLKVAGLPRTGVVNESVSGNWWLNDEVGPNATHRINDLFVPGLTHLIILQGIDDICFSPDQYAASASMISYAVSFRVNPGLSRSNPPIQVIIGTLPPYKGSVYYTAAGEAERQRVNAEIRSGLIPAPSQVVDFDLALQNPADPSMLNPAYDSGDHVHLNDAGQPAMAAAIDLALLQVVYHGSGVYWY
jgi:lysophospholipase L1-like esterase